MHACVIVLLLQPLRSSLGAVVVMSDSDTSSVVGGGPAAPPPAPQHRRHSTSDHAGFHRIFLVVACAGGFWPRFVGADGDSDEAAAMLRTPGAYLLGAVLVLGWSFVCAETSHATDEHGQMRGMASRVATCAQSTMGFLEYPILAVARLVQPTLVDERLGTDVLHAARRLPCAFRGRVHELGQVMHQWMGEGARPATIARLAPAFAMRVLRGWPVLHCVAVTRRIARARLLVADEPSKRQLSRLVRQSAAVVHEPGPRQTALVPLAAELTPASVGQWAMKSASLCLDWLAVSSHLKDIRSAPKVAEDFARIFARSGKVSEHQLLSCMETVSYGTLREARIRCDCASMLLWRRVWGHLMRTVPASSLHLYIYIDSSPQWRGLELLATSVDLFDGRVFVRRLLPVVSLERGQLDTLGKAMSLLWQLWLCFGPSFAAMRFVCSRVQAVCSDMGTESAIVNLPDALPAFFQMIAPAAQPEPPGDFLFGRGLQVPGWKHLWDNVLKRTLSSLGFFAAWLDKLKSLISFLRSVSVVRELSAMFDEAGLPAAKEILQRLKLPHFAAWRWGTLRDCCKGVRPILEPLSKHFVAQRFKHNRDSVQVQKVQQALGSEAFLKQFLFVSWVCEWIGELMDWCSFCSCRHDDSAAASVCPMRGRRWPEAFGFAKRHLRAGLAFANEWNEGSWGMDYAFLLTAQASIRGAFALSVEKLSFLDRLPYLLFRLRQPGIAQRALGEFDRTPEASHHRVSVLFLGASSRLRREVEAIRPDASGISPILDAELVGLSGPPLLHGGPQIGAYFFRFVWPVARWLSSVLGNKEG